MSCPHFGDRASAAIMMTQGSWRISGVSQHNDNVVSYDTMLHASQLLARCDTDDILYYENIPYALPLLVSHRVLVWVLSAAQACYKHGIKWLFYHVFISGVGATKTLFIDFSVR